MNSENASVCNICSRTSFSNPFKYLVRKARPNYNFFLLEYEKEHPLAPVEGHTMAVKLLLVTELRNPHIIQIVEGNTNKTREGEGCCTAKQSRNL